VPCGWIKKSASRPASALLYYQTQGGLFFYAFSRACSPLDMNKDSGRLSPRQVVELSHHFCRFVDAWALALLSGDVALLSLLRGDPLSFWARLAGHWQVTQFVQSLLQLASCVGFQEGHALNLDSVFVQDACGMQLGAQAPLLAQAILRSAMRADCLVTLASCMGKSCSEVDSLCKSFAVAFPQVHADSMNPLAWHTSF
jgi:hypothetical protein